MTMDDELYFELDDEPVSGKVAKSLPLVTPASMRPDVMSAASMVTVDYREELKLTAEPESLFDFKDTKLSPIQQMYIMGYAVKGTRKGACQMLNIPYSVVSKWMEDEEFVSALQNAVEIVKDSLEEEVMRRAMNGSDKLLIEAMKACKPEKYNKKQADVNINGTMVHTFADLAKMASVGSGEPPIDVTYKEEE